jgi:outer membrane usher protein FimD/PapC
VQYKNNNITRKRRRWQQRSVISFTLLAALMGVEKTQADDILFDTEVMKSRGVDPKIGEHFRQAPRFMAGESSVTLTVNGSGRGKINANFDENGNLCADAKFQKKAGLISPPGFSEDAACFDLRTAWQQTELNLDPGEGRIDLVVPPQVVSASGTESGNWNHGGFAGMLNYDTQYMDSSGSSSGVRFEQVGTEAGFNLSDWIVRSRQTYSSFNGETTMQHQAAYAQRTFTEAKKVFQAGQINLSNSMFGTGQVLGIQMFPEAALTGDRGGAGLVEGIADSQSVVEVRQSGVLVYSTTIPAGPFRLQGFPLLNVRSDLDVTVTGSNGEQRRFIVPASALLLNGSAVTPGLSFGVGKMEQQSSNEAPVIGTIADGWALTPHTVLNAGVLGSSPYRAAALGLDSQIFDDTLLTLQGTVAQDNEHNNSGGLVIASLSHNINERLGLSLNASQQTIDYRELSDALDDEDHERGSNTHNQYGGGISWSQELLGNFPLSYGRTTTFDGDTITYMRGGWSRSFGRTYVGASLEHNSGNRYYDAEDRLYVTINIPFGTNQNVSSYLNNTSRNGSRAGMRYSDRTSQDRGWSISGERDFRNERTSGTGSMDMVTPFTQLSGSVSRDSDDYTTWTARATGAIVAHDHGVTLSPYRVGDTFGIAKVGNESGVRLETPAGPTWTDSRGYAVLPSLSGYQHSTIQVDTNSLAKNIDIDNAWQETEAARGSVNYVNFEVVRTRRVLVDVKNSAGSDLPHGAGVFNSTGNFITLVGNTGKVFIPDAGNLDGNLDVQVSGKTICSFALSLPETAANDNNGMYETASAVCR